MVGQGLPYKERKVDFHSFDPAQDRFRGSHIAGCKISDEQGTAVMMGFREKFSVCKGLTRVQPYRKQISLRAELYGQEGK